RAQSSLRQWSAGAGESRQPGAGLALSNSPHQLFRVARGTLYQEVKQSGEFGLLFLPHTSQFQLRLRARSVRDVRGGVLILLERCSSLARYLTIALSCSTA